MSPPSSTRIPICGWQIIASQIFFHFPPLHLFHNIEEQGGGVVPNGKRREAAENTEPDRKRSQCRLVEVASEDQNGIEDSVVPRVLQLVCFGVPLGHPVTGALDNVQQLRDGEDKVDDLGQEEERQSFSGVAHDAADSEDHPGKVGVGVTNEDLAGEFVELPQGVGGTDEWEKQAQGNLVAGHFVFRAWALELHDGVDRVGDGDDQRLTDFNSIDTRKNVDRVCAEYAEAHHVDDVERSQVNQVHPDKLLELEGDDDRGGAIIAKEQGDRPKSREDNLVHPAHVHHVVDEPKEEHQGDSADGRVHLLQGELAPENQDCTDHRTQVHGANQDSEGLRHDQFPKLGGEVSGLAHLPELAPLLGGCLVDIDTEDPLVEEGFLGGGDHSVRHYKGSGGACNESAVEEGIHATHFAFALCSFVRFLLRKRSEPEDGIALLHRRIWKVSSAYFQNL